MAPQVLVLVGVPGSGKTEFAKKLCEYYPVWNRINQDELGSRPVCENLAIKYLKEGKNVIIDRCNFDEDQRKIWILLADQHGATVDALFFDIAVKVCKDRVKERTNHPTGVEGKFGVEVVMRFDRMLTRPTSYEGFRYVHNISPHLNAIPRRRGEDPFPKDVILSIMALFPAKKEEIKAGADKPDRGKAPGLGYGRDDRYNYGDYPRPGGVTSGDGPSPGVAFGARRPSGGYGTGADGATGPQRSPSYGHGGHGRPGGQGAYDRPGRVGPDGHDRPGRPPGRGDHPERQGSGSARPGGAGGAGDEAGQGSSGAVTAWPNPPDHWFQRPYKSSFPKWDVAAPVEGYGTFKESRGTWEDDDKTQHYNHSLYNEQADKEKSTAREVERHTRHFQHSDHSKNDLSGVRKQFDYMSLDRIQDGHEVDTQGKKNTFTDKSEYFAQDSHEVDPQQGHERQMEHKTVNHYRTKNPDDPRNKKTEAFEHRSFNYHYKGKTLPSDPQKMMEEAYEQRVNFDDEIKANFHSMPSATKFSFNQDVKWKADFPPKPKVPEPFWLSERK